MMECPMVDYQDFAAKALRDETLTRSECQAVLDTPDEQFLGLLQAAFPLRFHFFAKPSRPKNKRLMAPDKLRPRRPNAIASSSAVGVRWIGKLTKSQEPYARSSR